MATMVADFSHAFQRVDRPLPNELDAFRRRARPVYDKWAEKIGKELVHSVEKIVQDSK